MKSQIRGKARRNGPVYRFKLTDGLGAEIEGYSSRYRVVLLAPRHRGRVPEPNHRFPGRLPGLGQPDRAFELHISSNS